MNDSKKTIRAVGCFLEYDGKFAILQRNVKEPQGGVWGLPAGKVAGGEDDVATMLRELQEETGYKAREDELELVGEFHWDFPEYKIDFPTFRVQLESEIDVIHSPDEHKGFKWVTAEECHAMTDLRRGLQDLLEWVGYINAEK